MENKLKNKEADKQQEKGKTMSSYKKALRVILLLFAGMLIGQYIECYSCQSDVDTGYDERITNSVEKSIRCRNLILLACIAKGRNGGSIT